MNSLVEKLGFLTKIQSIKVFSVERSEGPHGPVHLVSEGGAVRLDPKDLQDGAVVLVIHPFLEVR